MTQWGPKNSGGSTNSQQKLDEDKKVLHQFSVGPLGAGLRAVMLFSYWLMSFWIHL